MDYFAELVDNCTRTIDGRLFTVIEVGGGWRISAQGDRAGYCCEPRKQLPQLRDYDSLEVILYGPDDMLVDPHIMDLPDHIADKFSVIEPGGGSSIGSYVKPSEIVEICTAIMHGAMRNPNFGVPRGEALWSEATLWHGTSVEAAEDILGQGINMDASSKGYFGRAFYAADKRELAVSNYASMAGDSAGAVVQVKFIQGARVLDLRNPADAETFAPFEDRIGEDAFDRRMRRAGIDAVYDSSMGGIAIYNPKSVQLIGIEDPRPTSGAEYEP